MTLVVMPNRLAHEKSPYLRQHADNPVDWYPWGEEAFAKARAEQKPVFLSIGYSTCHWCHVMAHESFENPEVAELLNRDFVPIKLDREERPDLDRIYMTFVQQVTGHGGWPMSVWLTPDLKPFYGGTYFPPEDRHGRPGFLTLLRAIDRHWREQRDQVAGSAEQAAEALRRYAAEGGARTAAEGETPAPDDPIEALSEAINQAVHAFHESHDRTWGGFGGAPKFPRPAVLDFLFRMAVLQGIRTEIGAEVAAMATLTLQRMAEGGVHDSVGGGFHRYSVDERWFVPHFEKMLYDQAQLAMAYLQARQATGLEVYAWVARGIFDYVLRDLADPRGGFYSAEDADSEVRGQKPEDRQHAEGAFYVWTKAEIDAELGEDAPFFCAHYGVREGGNVEQDPQGEFRGRNILMQRQSLAVTAREFGLEIEDANARLVACLEKLRARRTQRPHLDDKILTAWNGLMISAVARGHQVLGAGPDRDGNYLRAATRAAEFIRDELYDAATGTLFRSWRAGRSAIGAFSEDYAFLIQGLLDLYEAGFDIRWLQWAERLQAEMDALFWDPARGGYLNSRADDPSVIVRLMEDHDGAEPAAGSVAALNLLRLDWMLGGPAPKPGEAPVLSYRERAEKVFAALRPQWTRAGHALPQLLCAVELLVDPPRTVVLAGDPASAEFRALAAVLHERIGPRRVVLAAEGGEAQAWLAERRPYLREMKPKNGRATAYVCENFACREPVSEPEALRRLIGFS